MSTSKLPAPPKYDVTTKEGQIAELDDNIVSAIRGMASQLGLAVRAGRATCVHCVHFNGGEAEVCALAGTRPPAHVIAFGCPAFEDGTVPF